MPRLISLAVAVVAIAACNDPEDGALLTVRAPDGPWTASRLAIILANAEASAITLVDDQRLRPGDGELGSARYYRQRETGGELTNIARLDGFAVRISPNPERVPDEDFIPFALAYDGDALVGIGTVRDATGKPAPIQIIEGARDSYDVLMLPVTAADLAAGIAASQVAAFDCTASPSGLAWQPPDDEQQLRLLLPDAGAFDATPRDEDLDCDDHAAPDQDCDDLRASYNVDATEACDGEDVNCDGVRYSVAPCDSLCGMGTGSTVCDDAAGTQSQCVPNPVCRCQGAACNQCELAHVGATAQRTLCTPAEDKIIVPGCAQGTCDVAVIPSSQPWKIELSSDGTAFADAITITGNNQIHVKVEYLETTPVDAGMPDLGTIDLAVTENGATRYFGLALRLSPNTTDATVCPPPSSGIHTMVCTQAN